MAGVMRSTRGGRDIQGGHQRPCQGEKWGLIPPWREVRTVSHGFRWTFVELGWNHPKYPARWLLLLLCVASPNRNAPHTTTSWFRSFPRRVRPPDAGAGMVGVDASQVTY